MFGLRVQATRIARPGVGENLGGAALQLASVDVDDLELHLDAETGTLGGVEVDLHQFSPAGSLVPARAPTVGLQVRLGVVTNPAGCPFVTTQARVLSDIHVAARRTMPQAQCFELRQVLAGHAARIDRFSGPAA